MSGFARILVVDDEAEIADLVVSILAREHFAAQACYDAHEALRLFAQHPFDLMILDVMMPAMDGFELCARLRAQSDVPILFLTAKGDENDQVVGFSLGADDYITKPFKQRELVARVKARLRRRAGAQMQAQADDEHRIRVGMLEIDVGHHQASLLDEPVRLTPKEFDILVLLAQSPGKPVASKDIYESIWHEQANASSVNTVMVHIRNLRRKLAAIDSSVAYIQNSWGVGYSLRQMPS